ncbi:MAG: hypothetical protein M3Z53_02860, partial [Lactobacillus panisapium]|nr:hypothetical protein [Lactobacillus panisapium]
NKSQNSNVLCCYALGCLEIISVIKLLKSKKNPIINPMINIFLKSRKIKTCNEIKVIAGKIL